MNKVKIDKTWIKKPQGTGKPYFELRLAVWRDVSRIFYPIDGKSIAWIR